MPLIAVNTEPLIVPVLLTASNKMMFAAFSAPAVSVELTLVRH